MKITFSTKAPKKADSILVGVEEGRKLTASAQELDDVTSGMVSRAAKTGKFNGKTAQVAEVLAPAGLEADRIYLLGFGKEFDQLSAQKLGGTIIGRLMGAGSKTATIYVDAADDAEVAAQIAFGIKLGAYKFEKYITKKDEGDSAEVSEITIVTKAATSADQKYDKLNAVAEGVYLTRDVISEPPNVLYPETMANEAEKLSELGVKVTVLGEAEMTELGMGALLGVGQGSARESKLVVMEWKGGTKSEAPVAFVGKGVTFDTGGISLKPGPGMDEMKWDMGGSGVVLGLMKVLAGRQAKVNAIGVIGLVENMPDGNAQRPGDIVTSMSGQTIEILNTDAEGRLVLADALWYTQDKYKPQIMIDLATLTGAIMVSLGQEHAGLFSNDDQLAERLTAAGLATDDKVWRMPLGDAYDKQIKSSVADMKNIGGKYGGSITAAQFLQRYVNGTKWAHLDIAGVTWSAKSTATAPKGATGFGVKLLDRFVSEHYEG
ncbi:leucyl aminopeptidase [Curvivirga sp.]|uniref:leucyl aminopeptidase n=1 Tax=Curvivirga sp. TaxID=2856848 RepID=UPI003B59F8EF